MFRFGLNSLRFITDCVITTQQNAQSVLLNSSSSNSLLRRRLVHASNKYLKKEGQFAELTKDTHTTSTNKPKVKLYPGFQDSVEDLKNQTNDQITGNSVKNVLKLRNIFNFNFKLAKKVIEDFYGLNELEFEETEENESNLTPIKGK